MSAAHPRLLARLGFLFDRTVRIEKQGTGKNATGQQTAGFAVVAGMESIEAQRVPLVGLGQEITTPGGTKQIANFGWTLKGAYEINTGHQMVELDADGQPTSDFHAVLQSNIDPLGLTMLKTAQVKR